MNQWERNIIALVIIIVFMAAVGLALFGGEGGDELDEETIEEAPASSFNERYDIAYVEDGTPRQTLDLYVPVDADGDLPVLVWVHGGAWVTGDKAAPPILSYAADGFAVASLNYRYATTDPYPAQAEDVSAALDWLQRNAQEYGLDGEKIILVGHSAGAQLALVSALAANRNVFGAASPPWAVVGSAGPYDFTEFERQAEQLGLDTGEQFTRVGGTNVEDILLGCEREACPSRISTINPATYADAADPEVFLQHGQRDETVPYLQSTTLADRLEAAGVDVELRLIDDADHGFRLSDELDGFIRGFIGD